MKRITNYIMVIMLGLIISICTTGCSKDEMDGIEIVVTNYTNEYIVDRIYSTHSKISSIYPDGVDTYTYQLSSKLKKEYAKKDIFVYNGLIESERQLAVDLLDINPSLKIIDTAYILEAKYSPEELWLNPASLLMMSQNVKNGLEEYISSTYLQKEIDASYKELQIDLSMLDVEYRRAVNEVSNKNIVIDNNALKYLESFGLNVYCLEKASDKTLADIESMIVSGNISYIITFSDQELSETAKNLMTKYPDIRDIRLHRLNNITDKERDNQEDYLTIMGNNLTLLNQELYQ